MEMTVKFRLLLELQKAATPILNKNNFLFKIEKKKTKILLERNRSTKTYRDRPIQGRIMQRFVRVTTS